MAQVHPVPTKPGPSAQDMSDLANVIGNTTKLKVKQTVSIGDGCIGQCCEIKNRYNIYDPDDGRVIAFTTEESGCCLRTWCSPDHSLLMKIRLGDGNVKVPQGLNRKAWINFQGDFKQIEAGPAAYTVEREGCMSKPCLTCFACTPSCLDQMTFHKGDINGEPGQLQNPNPVFVAQQAPASESMFTPKINVFPAGSQSSVMSVEGPTFFGGLSELCCPTVFEAKNTEGLTRGTMVKPAPKGCMACCCQICTNFDEFDLYMEPDTTPEEKAALLTSTFLTDYMFFERDPGMCVYDANNKMCIITMCYMYCAGCMCPCKVVIPASSN